MAFEHRRRLEPPCFYPDRNGELVIVQPASKYVPPVESEADRTYREYLSDFGRIVAFEGEPYRSAGLPYTPPRPKSRENFTVADATATRKKLEQLLHDRRPQTDEQRRISKTERLIVALEARIAALEAGAGERQAASEARHAEETH
jgi:hypothetical protein